MTSPKVVPAVLKPAGADDRAPDATLTTEFIKTALKKGRDDRKAVEARARQAVARSKVLYR